MREALILLLLACAARPFTGVSAPQRDAVAILKDMRVALGGEAVLDDIHSISMRAEGEMTVKGMRLRLVDEYLLLLPDNYLRTRQLDLAGFQYATPNASKLFEGFTGARLIRALGGGRALPSPPTPDGDRHMLAKMRHDAARMLFALTGRSMSGEPMELVVAGSEVAADAAYEILEARAADGLVLRLHVDQKTHLPAMVTSTVPPDATETRWLLGKFKRTGPVNWPREIEEQAAGIMTATFTVKDWKVNPRIDARRFDVRGTR